MGLGLGNKIQKAFSSVGKKTDKITTPIGNKVNSVVKEAKGVVNVLDKKLGQVENTANQAYQDASIIVNKIPEYNEKVIQLYKNLVESLMHYEKVQLLVIKLFKVQLT